MIITVSGIPVSGKGTLGEYLAEVFNLKYYSMGDIRRKLADEMKIDINELNTLGEKDPFSDKTVDDYLKTLAKQDNLLVDGRMAYYFIPNSIKVFINVDLDEAARRSLKRKSIAEKYKNAKEARKALEERMKSDDRRYKKYYGVNVFDLSNYDIIFDTTGMTLKEAKETIVKSVKKFIKEKKDKRP